MSFFDKFKSNRTRTERGKFTLLQLSASPIFTNDPKSSDDDQLVKQARTLMQNGKWAEATSTARDGLQTCARKDRLCEVMGDICLEKNSLDAIGWYMQACLIVSPIWEPYLLVSYAARALGLDDLAWRCLNACDAIRSAPRIPDLERTIAVLVSKSDRSQLLRAMQGFERAMDPYLPTANEFPHDSSQRSIFLHQSPGDPTRPPTKQWLKLMRRA